MQSAAVTSAVLLAGGLGTRIRHLLGDRPKPMVDVAGRPFLEWVLHFLARQGIQECVISAGYRGEVIDEFCTTFTLPGLRVSCVQETEPFGTAGGFLHAMQAVGGSDRRWLVTNGDSLVCADLRALLAPDPQAEAGLLALPVPDASRYGSLRTDAEGFLTAFAEKSTTAAPGLINGGLYVFAAGLPSTFPPNRPLSFETDVFPDLLRRGTRLRVHQTDAAFLDIGTPETLAQAADFIVSNHSVFA